MELRYRELCFVPGRRRRGRVRGVLRRQRLRLRSLNRTLGRGARPWTSPSQSHLTHFVSPGSSDRYPWPRERTRPRGPRAASLPPDEGGRDVPIQPVEKIWMDGKLVDWEDATVHVLTHALHYGSGVFEGVRAYETKKGAAVFRLSDHIRRLFRSAHVYQMEIPFSQEELVEAVRDTVRENQMESCYIRPLVYRGYGEMGLNPLNAPVNVTVAVWPWGTYLGEESLETGGRAKISSWKRS